MYIFQLARASNPIRHKDHYFFLENLRKSLLQIWFKATLDKNYYFKWEISGNCYFKSTCKPKLKGKSKKIVTSNPLLSQHWQKNVTLNGKSKENVTSIAKICKNHYFKYEIKGNLTFSN